MQETSDTRASLLARLKDTADREAWSRFVAIYRPLVYRLARRRGLQDADAQDLAQQVLVAVAGKIADWTPDPRRARFRTWLSRVAENAIIDALRRIRPDAARGGSDALRRLGEEPEAAEPSADEVQRERRREVFRWAARRVRDEFAPDTWRAFWRTAVEGQPVAQVARELGKSPGAVYTARSRVMRRLKEVVGQSEEPA